MKDLLQIVFGLGVIVAFVWASVRIFQKAGYSGWLAVLYLIPVVNILTFFWFAAAEWPVEEELRRLRATAPPPGPSAAPSEEEAWELYHEAIGLEIAGRADEALIKFQQIIDTGPNTAAAQDAQKSIDALRSKPS
jgi:hypothetical protein